MAKNDFHVIVYRILDYLYRCMKEGVDPDVFKISAENLQISDRYFYMIIEELLENGYISGAYVVSSLGGKSVKVTPGIQIKLAGIEYLTDNSLIKKAERFYKEVRDTVVPFL